MSLDPLHPDEPALHRELRDALNAGLTSTDFLVWIVLEPTGERATFHDLDTIVVQTERWLNGLDPDTVDPEALPALPFNDKAASGEVRAIPKRPEARGAKPAEVVGNPEPALAGWLA